LKTFVSSLENQGVGCREGFAGVLGCMQQLLNE
jgi:hypothetical protein